MGIVVLLIAEMGWYERANMVANSRGNIIWILIAIVLISLGFGWIYQQFTWEMNEQRFNEIKHLKIKNHPNDPIDSKNTQKQVIQAFLACFNHCWNCPFIGL